MSDGKSNLSDLILQTYFLLLLKKKCCINVFSVTSNFLFQFNSSLLNKSINLFEKMEYISNFFIFIVLKTHFMILQLVYKLYR